MVILLTIVHVIVCLFLVVVVLLQSGKAADLAGAFGGMGSQTVFGPRGSATVLSKATTISAILFMITSMSLSIMATRGTGGGGSTPDIFNKVSQPQQGKQAAPLKPGDTAPIEVAPVVNGQKQESQKIVVPVVEDPNKKGKEDTKK